MKLPPLDYARPSTVAEATAALAADPDAKPLAGGQSLVPTLAFRLARPTLLVDLAGIAELRELEVGAGGARLGAMVRQLDAERSTELADASPLLVHALRHVAHPQIRSRGTVCGSIAHADPASELPAVALALDAAVHVSGPGGERTVPAADFFRGVFQTALGQGELVTAVELGAAPARTGAACYEVARRAGDYALAGAVAQVTLGQDDVIADCRVALFGLADRPVRASRVEEALTGSPAPHDLRPVAALVGGAIDPFDDVQASTEYRREIAPVVARRALEQALERAG